MPMMEEEATRKTLESGLNNGEKHPHPDLDSGQQEGFTEPPATRASWKYHTGAAPVLLRWLIKGILSEAGIVLMAGQWGTFKTTVALDVSVCVMADLPFAGRYRVKRRGAVLYIAPEGEGMLPARLSAIAAHHGVTGPLPFAWRGDCPALTNKDAVTSLCTIADEAAADLDRNFGLPVVLIWIDTVITAAGHDDGGDNDTAASQKVMNVLRILSQHTGALVAGIDHFGKVIETGTRGSSAKEGAADTVIALLADRELSGGVRNTRLAVRKQRDGLSGFEIPFTAQMVEIGTDDDGDPVTAPIIDWQATQQTAQADARWTPSMQLLRRVLMTILAGCGQDVRPFLDGPEVRACDIDLVRTEFYRQCPADGTEKQKTDARRKAFGRSVKDSIAPWPAARWPVSSSFGLPRRRAPMAKATGTDGRESGTGQDTPLGVCPCPAPLPAMPHGTWRDIVPSCPTVTHGVSRLIAKRQPHFPTPWLAPALLALGEPPRRAA